MRKLYIYELAEKLWRTNGGGKSLLVLFFMLLMGSTGAWANTYYGRLTANLASGATGKGLVYADNSNSTPATSSYATTITSDNSSGSSSDKNASVTLYAWAKPARGYQFSSWTNGSNASANSTTSASTSVSVTASSTNESSPTTGTVSANFTEDTNYKTITYQTPTDGTYNVAYSWDNALGSSGFTTGSASYDMMPSSADKAVKSYTTDQVTLTTTLDNFEGWYQGETLLSSDKTYTFTPSSDMTISAKFTAISGNEASVTSNGTTTEYESLLEAFKYANTLSTSPTVTLLRNVYTADTIYNITKSMTFDLNGYTLSGKGGRPSANSLARRMFYVNGTGIDVTFTDNSTAKTGTINITYQVNQDLIAVYLNNGTLNLNGGTIHAENMLTYNASTANRMRCYGVHVNIQALPRVNVLNVDGTTIEAVANYYAYAINTSGWYSGQSEVNIKSGTVKATGYNGVYGLNTYAKTTISGGTIEADITGGTWSSYGVCVNAASYSTINNVRDTTKTYRGTLNMTGGTVKATSTTSGSRAIRIQRSVNQTSGTNTVENIYSAYGAISGGTVIAEAATSTAMAVEAYGDCDITGGTFTASTGTSNCYGVRTVYGKTTISGDNTTITATGTQNVYGAVAAAEISGSTGIPAVGELEVNGGNITATTNATTNAYGILVQAAAIEITSTATNYYKGLYHAAAKATINGGKISATAKTSGGYAVFVQTASKTGTVTSGTVVDTATCVINDGMFIASGASNYACVNNAVSGNYFTIYGGYYQQSTNLAKYVPDDKTIYDLTSSINSTAYSFGCRYYVSPWDNTKNVAYNKNTSTYYTSLKAGLEAASSGNTVVLVENYRLTEAVTVPSGVTLLIPYDASYTSPTTTPTVVTSWSALSAYKTLTLTKDASITVNGNLTVAGQQYSYGGGNGTANGGAGSPVGAYGHIDMKRGGTITFNNGSNFYAWGFVTGQNMDEGDNSTGVGTITVANGAKVYEDVVLGDWRGGGKTYTIYNKTKGTNAPNYKLFPFCQFCFPNVEVPMIVNYGAALKSSSNIYINKGTSAIAFDLFASSGALFNMASGSSVTTHYDPTTDDTYFDVTGDLSVNSLSLSLSVSGFSMSIKSSDYVMPLPNGMKFRIHNGTLSVPYDVVLLPDAGIFIDEDAAVNVSANGYIFDIDDWGYYAYNNYAKPFQVRPTTHYLPSFNDKSKMQNAKVEVNGTLTISGNLYTTKNGSSICSNGEGKVVFSAAPTASGTLWEAGKDANDLYYSTSDYSISSDYTTYFCAVPVTAPQLENADGSYVATSGASAGTTYYYNVDTEKWQTTEPVLHPTFSLDDGTTYDEEQTLELTSRTDGATIRYSTDGGTTWTDYSQAIALKGSDGEAVTTTVQAKAVKNGTESVVVTATYTVDLSKRPVFAYDEGTGEFTLTNQGIVTEEKLTAALTAGVTGTLLSVDLTPGTCDIDAATLRSLILNTLSSAKVGSNYLLYINEATAAKETTDVTENVVVKGSDGSYTAESFVVADKQPLCVPTAFTATSASYSRTGSNQWGTICLPFELTSGNSIQYYELESVKGNQMTFTKVDKVAANTPAVYSLSGSSISIEGNNVSVPVTSSKPVDGGGCTLVGVQTGTETLADGSSNYYIAQNKFWQPTGTNVTISPQRAYFQIDSSSGAKVFSIGVDDTATAIDGIDSGSDDTTIVGVYSVNGVRQEGLQRGINIVKFSDGTTRKVVIK